MAQFTNGNAAEREPVRLAEATKPLNRFPTLFRGSLHFAFRGFESLENYVFGVLESSGLETALNEFSPPVS
jgi:hypothetical protein